uniref:Transposase n=1 Tax=Brugia timori TaxID=42155 RepID=A0A0R3QU85_9BILA
LIFLGKKFFDRFRKRFNGQKSLSDGHPFVKRVIARY